MTGENVDVVGSAAEDPNEQSETQVELTSFQLFTIRFAATTLIYLSAAYIVEFITGLFNDQLEIRFDILFVLAGFGLLRFKESARWWTVFCSWLLVLIMIIVVIGCTIQEQWHEFPKEDLSLVLLMFVFSIWFIYSLGQESLKAHFTERGKAELVWPWVILVFCLALSLFIYAKDAEHERTIKAIRYTEVTLRVCDSQSGKPLNISLVQRWKTGDEEGSGLSLESLADGMCVSWLGVNGRSVAVSSEGYSEVELELTHADDNTEKLLSWI